MTKIADVALSSAVLVLVEALSGCQSTTGNTVSQTMNDASITTAVQAKLMRDRLSNFPRIDVDPERGIVNLSGVVETEAPRAQAHRLAHQVEGVVRQAASALAFGKDVTAIMDYTKLAGDMPKEQLEITGVVTVEYLVGRACTSLAGAGRIFTIFSRERVGFLRFEWLQISQNAL